MGIGSARGEDRAKAAAVMAISSPLLEASIDGARGVLLSISGGSDLGLFEINEAAQLVSEAAHPEANIIFGAVIDDALGDEVRVTVIAAGFDGGQPPAIVRDPVVKASTPASAAPERPATRPSYGIGSVTARPDDSSRGSDSPAPVSATTAAPVPPQVQPVRQPYVESPAEELDVPDFLK
jgi:cell division protein FtsZ